MSEKGPRLTKVTITRDFCFECGQPKGTKVRCTLTVTGRHRFTQTQHVDLKELFGHDRPKA